MNNYQMTDSTAMPPEFLFPLASLPLILQHSILESLWNIKAPVSLLVASALSVLSVAGQHRLKVMRPNGLVSHCGLNLVLLADSGERKTAADNLYMAPVREFQKRHDAKMAERIKVYQGELERFNAKKQGRMSELEKIARKRGDTTEIEAEIALLEATKPNRPKGYRLSVEDITDAALMRTLHENHPTGGIFSNEGMTVLNAQTMRNPGNINKIAWDGGGIRIDRVTSDSFELNDVDFMFSIMIQPEMAEKFFARGENAARESGLLARGLIAYPGSTQGRRLIDGVEPDRQYTNRYLEEISKLLEKNFPDDLCSLKERVLTFSAEAKSIWLDHYNRVESQMLPTGKYSNIRDAASKNSEYVARIAALFHHLNASADCDVISADTLRQASAVAIWYLDEFKRIFDRQTDVLPEYADACLLRKWLQDRVGRGLIGHKILRSQLQRLGPNMLRKKDRLEAAIEVLRSCGQIWVYREGKQIWIFLNQPIFPTATVNFGQPMLSAIDAVSF